MEKFSKMKKNPFKNSFKETLYFKVGDREVESNNIPKNENNEQLAELHEVAIKRYKQNRKVYNLAKRVKNIKFFINYSLPVISSIVAGAYIFENTVRKSDIIPTYQIEQTMISDGKMIKDIDDNQYIVTDLDLEDSEAQYIEADNTNSMIQYQVKNGTHSVIVSLNVDDEGELSIGDALSGNFFDRNAASFEGVEPTDIEAKYQEIVDDIGAFIEESSLNNSYKNEIKEMLEQERTVIITTIVEYVKSGEISVVESEDRHKFRIIGLEALNVIAAISFALLLNIAGLGRVKKLGYDEDGKLRKAYTKEAIIPFKTSASQKDCFIKAENSRRSNVKTLARNYLIDESYVHFDK